MDAHSSKAKLSKYSKMNLGPKSHWVKRYLFLIVGEERVSDYYNPLRSHRGGWKKDRENTMGIGQPTGPPWVVTPVLWPTK